jgi:beta-glucuronidase
MLENLRASLDRPAIISEFGADGGPHHHGFAEEKGTEECQRAVYERQVLELGKADYLAGTISWLMFDFRTPRRLHISQRQSLDLKRYNIKGVLSADKKHRKLAFYVLRDFYAGR